MTADEAIPLAIDALKKLFDGNGYRLEEVEFHNDGDFDITVSFYMKDAAVPNTTRSELMTPLPGDRIALGIDPYRTYKVVRIGKDGMVKTIRIRELFVSG